MEDKKERGVLTITSNSTGDMSHEPLEETIENYCQGTKGGRAPWVEDRSDMGIFHMVVRWEERRDKRDTQESKENLPKDPNNLGGGGFMPKKYLGCGNIPLTVYV